MRLMDTSPLCSGIQALAASDFFQRSEDGQHAEKHSRKHATDERTNHGNRGIAPIRAAFPCNRKNGMRDARSEISRRIDRVSGWPAQRQTNAPDQAAHEIRAESRPWSGCGDTL